MRASFGPRTLFGLVVATAILALGPAHVSADGGGGSSSYNTPGRADDPDYTAAVKAIKDKDYPSAIRLLQGVVQRDAKNADAYNWLAYAMRKNGDAAGSIPVYHKALALDPNHRGAHEYIGEAYLALDDLPKAKQHLATLDKLCFLPCSEYSDLKRSIAEYEKRKASR